MFGISSTELMIIAIFGFLLFGPDKLPQMGHTIGRALRQFRETQERMTSVVQAEVIDPMTAAAQAPLKPKGAASSADATDDDADIEEGAATAAPRRKETFAERRARLAAEKAASEDASTSASDEGDAAEPEQPAAEPGQPAELEQVEPVVRTTEDLYARRPRKRPTANAGGDVEGEDR
ncbi:MAG: twin-arginine translocase TatA/TatE family subunit [Collinsella sp.]|nr:twin-arginine translocase TatA/TatE family subunit [Collinsella sp.]